MVRARNRRYPNFSLSVAIDYIRKVFDADWTNALSREVVAQHLGYGGLSGASDSCIGTLRQYGLLERTGKNEMKVSQLAIDILQPASRQQKQAAIDQAAFCPPLFSELGNHFRVSAPSEAALRHYLIQKEFRKAAITKVVKAYTDTVAMTSRVVPPDANAESSGDTPEFAIGSFSHVNPHSDQNQPTRNSVPMAANAAHDGFSEWFRANVGRGQQISIAHRGDGEIGVAEIEKMITLLEAQKLVLEDQT